MAARSPKLEVRDTEYDRIQKWLTPSEEEQAWLILQGKCPHNGGWRYGGHGHNDEWYQCKLCGDTKDY